MNRDAKHRVSTDAKRRDAMNRDARHRVSTDAKRRDAMLRVSGLAARQMLK